MVPSAFEELLRAEHTTATWFVRVLGLGKTITVSNDAAFMGGKGHARKEYDILDDLLDNLVGEFAHACTSELLNNPV